MTWWRDFYDDLLAETLLVRSDAGELERTAKFLEAAAGLVEPSRVFDQCCGIGSVAVVLARRGHRVVGVDQAAGYIERARRDAAGLPCELVVGDAFSFVCAPPARLAFNWWTSFGHAGTDGDNARMLARAFESLEPGGTFALDTLHLPSLLSRFEPVVVTRRSTPLGEVELTRESTLDLAAGHLHKVWTYRVSGRDPVVHRTRVRLFAPHRLVELLEMVGFREVALFGDVSGAPIDRDSPRCIAVARKPR